MDYPDVEPLIPFPDKLTLLTLLEKLGEIHEELTGCGRDSLRHISDLTNLLKSQGLFLDLFLSRSLLIPLS